MNRLACLLSAVVSIAAALILPTSARAAANDALERDARNTLNSLYQSSPAAKAMGPKAKAILVFPKIIKAGLGVGGQTGDGVMLKGNKTVGYYNTSSVSVGLQLGAQTYGYAMFLMSDAALKHAESTDGWEIGVGPSVVVMDEGMAKSTTTTTYRDDIYVFFVDQKGLMGGMGVTGTKVTRLKR